MACGGAVHRRLYRRGIDLGRVAEFDPRGRQRDGDVDRGAVIVDHQVEVAERRIIGVVLQRAVGQQPLEHGFHLGQEGDQRPVGVASRTGWSYAPEHPSATQVNTM